MAGSRRSRHAGELSGYSPATAAHLHEGATGIAGPVVVSLAALTGGNANGCVQNLDAELVVRIQQNPAGFYVTVHNANYPDGAARGQLGQ